MASDMKRDLALDSIGNAVADAIDAGVSPREFVKAACELWEHEYSARAKLADSEFVELLRRSKEVPRG